VRRDEEKFDDMLRFAERLPGVRATARRLLSQARPDRERTLALAIRLLDVGLFRVGWDRYARDNGHVGLTTLRRDQVTLRATEAHFDFIAKSGKRRRMTVGDPQSVHALQALKRRRGRPEELLVYQLHRDWHRIHAPDVNNVLRAWADGPYSAKEFRTWAATVIAAVELAREHAEGHSGPRAVNRAVGRVSTALGNTPAVARGSYIDPLVITRFEAGTVVELPAEFLTAADPVMTQTEEDGVVLQLPSDGDGDALRLDIEQRVYRLLS
jgi:DNA topoisomerase IB